MVKQVEEVLEDIPSSLFGKPFNRLCPHISIMTPTDSHLKSMRSRIIKQANAFQY